VIGFPADGTQVMSLHKGFCYGDASTARISALADMTFGGGYGGAARS
jgi:hypothetical protein